MQSPLHQRPLESGTELFTPNTLAAPFLCETWTLMKLWTCSSETSRLDERKGKLESNLAPIYFVSFAVKLNLAIKRSARGSCWLKRQSALLNLPDFWRPVSDLIRNPLSKAPYYCPPRNEYRINPTHAHRVSSRKRGIKIGIFSNLWKKVYIYMFVIFNKIVY